MKPANSILSSYGTTVFEVMSRLAIEHEAVNLGQGFPDGNGPDDVRNAAHEALDGPPNQYPPMMGVPELRQAVAAHNKRFYGLDVDWQTETLVTSGATEALGRLQLRPDRAGRRGRADRSRFTTATCRSSGGPVLCRSWCASNRRTGNCRGRRWPPPSLTRPS